jgi:hypothetical protein
LITPRSTTFDNSSASTPAILISAAPNSAIFPHKKEHATEVAEHLLFQAFLQKPFDIVPLLSTIARLVGPGVPSRSKVDR